MKLYKIRNWNSHYENNRTRELKKMAWVPVPNSHDGDGYTELVSRKEGAAILGAWLVILQVASRCDPRGTLLRSGGRPHDSASLARITRLSEPIIAEALRVCVDEIQWIEYEEVKSTPHEGAAISHDGAALPQAGDQEWNGMNGMNMSLPLHMPEARPKAPSLTPQQARLKLLFRTKASPFSDKEVKAWKRMPPIDEQELTAIERYYRMKERGGQKLYKMKSLTTLLNRWDEAVDWALNFKETSPL